MEVSRELIELRYELIMHLFVGIWLWLHSRNAIQIGLSQLERQDIQEQFEVVFEGVLQLLPLCVVH